jgi:hypothetical protein
VCVRERKCVCVCVCVRGVPLKGKMPYLKRPVSTAWHAVDVSGVCAQVSVRRVTDLESPDRKANDWRLLAP